MQGLHAILRRGQEALCGEDLRLDEADPFVAQLFDVARRGVGRQQETVVAFGPESIARAVGLERIEPVGRQPGRPGTRRLDQP
jgi:hypothetical protein